MLGLSRFLAYKRNKLGNLRGEEFVEAKEGPSLDCKREDPFAGRPFGWKHPKANLSWGVREVLLEAKKKTFWVETL